MKLCDILTYIPMKTTYPSLNLAQAVMLYAYLLSENNMAKVGKEGFQPGQSKYLAMKNSITNLLRDTKIHSNPNIYQRIFERLAMLGDDDVNLILSVCETLSNKKG